MAMKINKHIEIVRSNSPGLSSLSMKSCVDIYSVLAKQYSTVGVTTVGNLADLELLVRKQPDLVFPGMKFMPDGPDRIWLSAYLDAQGTTYTGSAYAAHFLENNKALAKQRIIDAGIVTAPFCVINQADSPAIDKIDLDFPLFVKPLSSGGGSGIDSASVVYNHSQLRSKIHAIARDLRADALIEQYLPGREFSVAILKNETSPGFSVMALELIAPKINGARLLSKEVKSGDSEQVIRVNDQAIEHQINELALDAFYALGARDYGRIDIRLDEFGKPHFLEANLMPSLTSGYGSFPKACEMSLGLTYESMILRIVRLALNRTADNAKIALPIPAISALESLLPALEAL